MEPDEWDELLDDCSVCLSCKRLIGDHGLAELLRCEDILDGFLRMMARQEGFEPPTF